MYSNNAKGELLGNIGASTTTMTIKDSKGGLFPPTYPYYLTLEQISNGIVTAREIVQVTNRVADTFTIVRSAGYCPVDDNAITQTNTAKAFTDGALVQLRAIAEDFDQINADLTTLGDNKLDKSTYNAEKIAYVSSSTGNDDYAITVPDITAYTEKNGFKVKADVGNTGTATLNVNGLGAKTLKKLKDSAFVDLETGDIIPTQIFRVTYNSSSGGFFQFDVSPAQVVIPYIASTKSTFIAGENITPGNALYLHTDGKVYKTDATNSDKIDFIGFATNSTSIGGNVIVDTEGVSNTQSGLTIGSNYYLSNTPGAISNTPGTNVVSVGKAISTTGIEINIKKYLYGDTYTNFTLSNTNVGTFTSADLTPTYEIIGTIICDLYAKYTGRQSAGYLEAYIGGVRTTLITLGSYSNGGTILNYYYSYRFKPGITYRLKIINSLSSNDRSILTINYL